MRWTDEELDYLFENYDELTNEELASELNRSIPSVSCKLHELGLKRTPRLAEYTLYHKDDILAHGTIEEIAEQTNLKPSTVEWYGRPAARKQNRNMILVRTY